VTQDVVTVINYTRQGEHNCCN